MKNKIILVILTMSLLSFLLTGCGTPPEPLEFKTLNIGHGFTANVEPVSMRDFTEPPYGFYNRQLGRTITMQAKDVSPYAFYKWEIRDAEQETLVEVFEEEHTFEMLSEYHVFAYFGCLTDEACKTGFTCDVESKQCI